MTWTQSLDNGGSPITAYEVWYNQGPITNTFVKYSEVDANTLTETITTVTAGDPYVVLIITANRLGSSTLPSESVTVYAASAPEAPSAPTRVAGTNAQTTIDIEWTSNGDGGSGILGYEVWWNGGGTGPVTGLKASLAGSATTTQITDLIPGTYYGFAIKAVNIVDSSSLSDEATFIAATVPAKPLSISLDYQSETAITFSWVPDSETGGSPLLSYKL